MSGRISNFLWVIGFCAVLGAVGQVSKENTSVTLGRFPQTLNVRQIRPTISHATFMAGFRKKRGNMVNAGMRSFSALSWRGKEQVACASNSRRMYEKGEGVRADSIKLTVGIRLMTDQPAQGVLRAAASNKRQSLAGGMTADQIAKAQAMARASKTQRGS